jgi:hypothetical protein
LDLNRLTLAEKQEMAQLIKQAFDALPADEGREANVLYLRINQQPPATQEQIARFNSLLQKGVSLLSVEQQQRLTVLFGKAVRTPTP